jgi:hypothetical protein
LHPRFAGTVEKTAPSCPCQEYIYCRMDSRRANAEQRIAKDDKRQKTISKIWDCVMEIMFILKNVFKKIN